ncbi:unnamed protein product, partial [Tetraodon nigroviridis]
SLLWRNSTPIMIEVVLLPDCCYGDEWPPKRLQSSNKMLCCCQDGPSSRFQGRRSHTHHPVI